MKIFALNQCSLYFNHFPRNKRKVLQKYKINYPQPTTTIHLQDTFPKSSTSGRKLRAKCQICGHFTTYKCQHCLIEGSFVALCDIKLRDCFFEWLKHDHLQKNDDGAIVLKNQQIELSDSEEHVVEQEQQESDVQNDENSELDRGEDSNHSHGDQSDEEMTDIN